MKQQRANNPRSGRNTRIRGEVIELDLQRCRVKVRVDDLKITSPWLNVLVPNNTENKVWWMPDIGDRGVGFLDEEGQSGEWLGAFYSDRDPPPINDPDKYRVEFSDGTAIEFDRKTSTLFIDIAEGEDISLEVRGAKKGKILFKGDLTIECEKKLTIAAKEQLKLVSELSAIAKLEPSPPPQYFPGQADPYFTE